MHRCYNSSHKVTLSKSSFETIAMPMICSLNRVRLSFSLFNGGKIMLFSNKGLVKLIQQVKIAHSFLQYVSNLSHFIILSFAM